MSLLPFGPERERLMKEAKVRTDRGPWIGTYTGRAWYSSDPRPEDVDIEDIAHALSMLCRYGGHCKTFYSVAEHSLAVSYLVPIEDALSGLLHDATEAYVVDMPRPIKSLIQGYKPLEAKTWRAIAQKFGVPEELPESVKYMDNAILFVEKDQLMAPMRDPSLEEEWGMGLERDPAVQWHISGWDPSRARIRFLNRFKELTHVGTRSSP